MTIFRADIGMNDWHIYNVAITLFSKENFYTWLRPRLQELRWLALTWNFYGHAALMVCRWPSTGAKVYSICFLATVAIDSWRWWNRYWHISKWASRALKDASLFILRPASAITFNDDKLAINIESRTPSGLNYSSKNQWCLLEKFSFWCMPVIIAATYIGRSITINRFWRDDIYGRWFTLVYLPLISFLMLFEPSHHYFGEAVANNYWWHGKASYSRQDEELASLISPLHLKSVAYADITDTI